MASDLIYREDSKDFVRHAYHKGLNPIDYLDEVPAADVRAVQVCPECGEEHVWIDYRPAFCECCGADMRKVVEIDQVKEGAE